MRLHLTGAVASGLPSITDWYTGDPAFDIVMAIELLVVACVPLGAGVAAPYGKHANDALGSFHLNAKFGWWLMELPATVLFLLAYFLTQPHTGAGGPSPHMSMFLAGLFIFHYAYRGWYFPFNIRAAKDSKTSFSIAVSLGGAIFTAIHGYLHARLYRSLGRHLSDAWAVDPRFIVGLIIYELGFWTMVHSDYVLRNLRPADGSGPRYRIPMGGAFSLVTSPQYLGEITAFSGLALMNWSLPGLAVMFITMFNLVPRALQNHSWYLEKFGDEYEALNRKRIVPFLC